MKIRVVAFIIIALLVFAAYVEYIDQTSSSVSLSNISSKSVPIETSELSPQQRNRIRENAETWPKTPQYENQFNALTPSIKVSALTATLFNPNDEYWGLPREEDASHELIDIYCSGCHSLSIVMQQRSTYDGWQDLLTWMEKKQGMPPLPEEDKKRVIAYLAKHFPRYEEQ
ncbi:hypothetical protein [Kordiimonas sp. SCSIO 12610]|uniref:hypothetical protein n=1 Tax=Kordiimonas sp. SCSIO 12610 TaxID=2829597 RepID=UPI0021091141|nr:hypothetical protein [Kordiimonas sp. SCSIO 12610]UTW54632.1 hypothetical protein KFF44_12580 [Kordiimonas sp. SCSIO 12610]